MNQIDLIDPLIANDAEKELVARIVAGRQNLRDRFSFRNQIRSARLRGLATGSIADAMAAATFRSCRFHAM